MGRITYNRGTTYTIQVNYSNSNNVAGTTAMFTVKATPGYDTSTNDSTAILKKDASMTNNAASIVILPSDIPDTQAPGNFTYDVKVLDANSAIYLIDSGQFVLEATPTNRLT
jgi:hypothetical protein